MAGAGSEQFEAFFQRADLDRDGRISGAEAVGFFQGSNLAKPVLAQIWKYADQNQIGYLSRQEFYNALKLVTVAQSKRELTPDIVKAALYGPASAKIPAPQINLANTPGPQPNMVGAAPSPRMGAPTQVPPQNYGFRGQTPSPAGVNPQFGLAPSPSSAGMNQQFRPAQPLSTNRQFGQVRTPSTVMNQQYGIAGSSTMGLNQQFGQVQRPSTGLNQQFGPAASNANMNQQFAPPAPVSQVLNRGPTPSIPPNAPNPQNIMSSSPSIIANDPKGYATTTNRSLSDAMFGGDVFSANRSSSQQASSAPHHPASSITTSSSIVPVASTPQPSANQADPFEALQSTVLKPSARVQPPQTAAAPKPNQQVPNQITSAVSSPATPAGLGTSTSEQSQTPWPKMTRAGIQKYAKVFMEVDKDRDGKITGLEARNLFLSWKLPIEILKKVWDLSDQDSDSMLSLREFCIALYLMEKYREGRELPSTLPNSVMLDETLLSLAGPPSGYGMGWGTAAGIRPQQNLPGVRPMTPAGPRPHVQPKFSQADGSMQMNQQNLMVPGMDNSHANHLSNGERNSVEAKGPEVSEANEKVENKENVLLDSREKLEFYRTKMQDLVLYKSRCDNRLNEITERARADKAEAESLEKKYQERYKQVAELHSKLTIEEASFREVQERKSELHQAIIKMEQGGSADGILQVRADRIQSDLEELLKALGDRCKKHDVQIKSAALIELPPGWHPGIPAIAAIWDEDWDKFDDEGFSFDVVVPANSKPTSAQRESSSPASVSPDTVSNTDAAFEKPFSSGAGAFDAESVYSADESKSPRGSPRSQITYESPTRDYKEDHFRRSSDGDAETLRNFDEPAWGSFDNNDDIDSVWGFGAKDTEHGKTEDKYFFGSNEFTASPDRTASPSADSSFNKPYTFEDSVSGSPLSRTGNSPSRNSMESSRDLFFDNFSGGFDSFSAQDQSSSPRNLSRFDSVNSTAGFDHSRDYSFDDSDPFGSTGPFKVSSETPKRSSDNWSSF